MTVNLLTVMFARNYLVLFVCYWIHLVFLLLILTDAYGFNLKLLSIALLLYTHLMLDIMMTFVLLFFPFTLIEEIHDYITINMIKVASMLAITRS